MRGAIVFPLALLFGFVLLLVRIRMKLDQISAKKSPRR